MTFLRPRLFVAFSALFALGMGVGIWLQHRWPLGRVRDEWNAQPQPTAATLAQLAQLDARRRLVIVCVGQSNAANYGESRRAAGAGIYAFAAGRLYAAADPLPGGDGYGGSIWTRLGARLVASGNFDAVVFAVVAQGSTTAADWAETGGHHVRLTTTLRDLSAAGLPPDFILWQQGEQEARSPAASGRSYAEALASVQTACRLLAPGATFLPALVSHTEAPAANEQIRLAQRTAGTAAASAPGPDLDRLGADFRHDGIHFSNRGLDAAADLWLDALRAPLAKLQNVPRTP